MLAHFLTPSIIPLNTPSCQAQFGVGVTEAELIRLADLVAERVLSRADGLGAPRPYLTLDQVAELLSVSRGYVYEHAAELGGRRLGTGPKARLRFSLEDVEAAIPCLADRRSQAMRTRTVERHQRSTVRSGLGTDVELLPIRGRLERGPR